MSGNKKKYHVGTIVSADLTVPNAEDLKDFYEQVIGWTAEELKMGNHSDYMMKDDQSNWVSGLCHTRGINNGIPPQWIVYIHVADIKESINKCKKLGGKVIKEATDNKGNYIYAILQDPEGAVIAVTHVPEENE